MNSTLFLMFSNSLTNRPEERLNLDVTAMIACVSSLTNGGCNFKFKEPLLTQQAEWERDRPAKPLLDKAFQGMKISSDHSYLSIRIYFLT